MAGGSFQAVHGPAGGYEPVQAAQIASGILRHHAADGGGSGILRGEDAVRDGAGYSLEYPDIL